MAINFDAKCCNQRISLPCSQSYMIDFSFVNENFYVVFGFDSDLPVKCFELPRQIQSELEVFSYSEISRFKVGEKIYLVIHCKVGADKIAEKLTQLLTNREQQIMPLVAKGLSNKQIARHLSISEWTVSTHLRRMFIKLKVDNRTAMVCRCFPICQSRTAGDA